MTAWAATAADLWRPRPELDTPIAYAVARSRGAFLRYLHLEAIEREILRTIVTGGRLVLSASVRHGKSQLSSRWLPAWYLGRWPDRRVILAGHEADFASRWGRAARDILAEHGPTDWGIEVDWSSHSASRWDIAGHAGGMLTVGVGGSPVGRGADLMVIDDPIKSYADAMSATTRQHVKEWWSGTMAHRLEPGSAVILIMARWHEDDLAGFLLREDPDTWREIRLPALCDDPATDPLGRAEGEALWPERWPVEALDKAHRDVALALGEVIWQAQYQQRPSPPGGGMFPRDRWGIIGPAEVPAGLRWVRGWDLAASKDTGDWTVGVRCARLPDGRFLLDDVVRGQWEGWEVRAQLLAAVTRDPQFTAIRLPQDPGQAGKDQAQQLVNLLSGQNVKAELQSGSKEVRAVGYSAQQQAGNVLLVRGPWNRAWIQEHESFPRGAHDDQVDAGASAFNAVALDLGAPMVRSM